MTDETHYDALETRDPEVREAEQLAALRAQIAHARAAAPHFAAALAEVDPEAVTDRAALARLPVLRKAEVVALQRADPPFGGLVAAPAEEIVRLFVSPGPIYEPQGRAADYWRMARALHAAGFRAGDVVHNSFGYHLTPGAAIMESGALALGCTVIPGGVGNTEQQVQVIADLRPVAYTGTPDFLKTLLDKAAELGRDVSSIARAMVSGAALPSSLRAGLTAQGVDVLQCYATAELGLIAYETTADGAPCEGMVVDEGVIVEIVRPGTGDPVPEGEVGEVVVTSFNPVHPLIRFATGDLSAVLPGASPCGRTGMRLKGWMGRADQTAKVRGMFVRPEQVAEVVGRHPEVVRARLVVAREGERDAMTLVCESAGEAPGLAERIAQTVAEVTKLRGTVELVVPGTLPADGKVIDDTRPVG